MFQPDSINIVDTQTPIMVMVGPIGCGKTMVIYRLFDWLFKNGYRTEVDCVVRPFSDTTYSQFATHFVSNLRFSHRVNPPHSVLYKAIDRVGNTILQVFDTEGAEWFDMNCRSEIISYSHQLSQLFSQPNKKIWVYMTEPEWGSPRDRFEYVRVVEDIYHRMTNKGDKNIILLNKIDEDPVFHPLGHMKMIEGMGMEKFLDIQYPNLLDIFKNKSCFTSWFKPVNCTLIPFMTGIYQQTDDGQISYCPGSDVYPANLWKIISGCNYKIVKSLK